MLRDYDIEGLCAATRSVTGDYLTEEEQSHFFHLLCHFNKTYCANHEKPIFNKTNDFKILGCIVSSMSQGQCQDQGYLTDLLDPTQVESKNTIVKSNGLSRVLMLNLWIFSLEKNKSENSSLNNLTIYYKLI